MRDISTWLHREGIALCKAPGWGELCHTSPGGWELARGGPAASPAEEVTASWVVPAGHGQGMEGKQGFLSPDGIEP